MIDCLIDTYFLFLENRFSIIYALAFTMSSKHDPSSSKRQRTSSPSSNGAKQFSKRTKKANAGIRYEQLYASGWDTDMTPGNKHLIGMDEAGQGCLAGPVMCAACVFLDPKTATDTEHVIRDSKTMSAAQRERTFEYLRSLPSNQFLYTLTACSPSHIDQHNILESKLKGMYQCIHDLHQQLSHQLPQPNENTCTVLIDGPIRPVWAQDNHQRHYTKKPLIDRYICESSADLESVTVAAASILAKHSRDLMMKQVYDSLFPGYDFKNHKGYGTMHHCAQLAKRGGQPNCHRFSFRRVPRSSSFEEHDASHEIPQTKVDEQIQTMFPDVVCLTTLIHDV